MSGSKAKVISEINLDEFERRLRAAGAPPSGAEDPLSELTRLVNTIAAERPQVVKVVDIATARMPKSERFQPVSRPVEVVPPPTPNAVEAEDEAEAPILRSGIEEAPAAAQPETVDYGLGQAAPAVEPAETAQYERARSGSGRSWALKVGALTALGVIMVAGAAAMKLGVPMPGLPKTPPLILALTSPSKVAPPSESAVQSPGDSGALLLKDSATMAPVKLVSKEEQPIDLRTQTAAPQPTTSASASPTASPQPTASASAIPTASPQPTAAAASPTASPVPTSSSSPQAAVASPQPSPSASVDFTPVAPSRNTPVVAPSENLAGSATVASPLFPAAKPVKTVSVRPDGTVISLNADNAATADSAPAPTATPALVKTPDAPPNTASVQPATPKLDLPTKLSPKSSARVATAKTDTTAPASESPLQLGPSAAKPARPAKPKPAEVVASAAPAAAAPTPAPVPAAAADVAPAPSGAGDWAVQLGAPRSEAEAHSAVSRLQSKYADQLGGAPLGVHKAEVNGGTIYRIRVGGLSRADATALCGKVKAGGGDCFVAKN